MAADIAPSLMGGECASGTAGTRRLMSRENNITTGFCDQCEAANSVAHSRRLVRYHLPLPTLLCVNLQCADTKTLLTDHLHVTIGSQHSGVTIETDFEVAKGERFVSG